MATHTAKLTQEPSHVSKGCDRLGQLLFLQLDPTLRNLLAVLQRHQALVESPSHVREECFPQNPVGKDESSIGSFERQNLEYDEEILGLLKAESELLLFVQEIISEFPHRIKSQEINSSDTDLLEDQIRGAMAIMVDYITLPLVAILRRPVTTRDKYLKLNQDADGDTNLRKFHIRQGAERKSIAISAQTLKICLEIVIQGTRGGAAASQQGECILLTTKILKLILTCSSVLPSGQEIAEQFTASFRQVGIDRGEEYLESSLDVIDYLLKMGTTGSHFDCNNDDTGSFGEEIAKAMDGALVAHLVDVCLSIVAPPSNLKETTILTATTTLHTLLNTVPDLSTWRALFPGTFAALFRTLIVGLRGVLSAPQCKSKVADAVLKVFLELLRTTLKSDDKTGVDAKKKGNAELFANLQRLAIRSGDEMDSTTKARKRPVLVESGASSRNQPYSQRNDSRREDSFLTEVNTRLLGPLTLLAKLLVSAKSPSIRHQAAGFCQLILIDSRSSWNRETLDDLSVMAVETCLILTRDGDDGVVSGAKRVLTEYQETAAWKKDTSKLLVPRILSMIEELPALAQRQSEDDLRNKLKLITAFLSMNKNGKALRSALAAEDVSLNLRKALAALLDVDFGSPSIANGVSIELLDHQNLLESKPCVHGSNRRLHLTPASEEEAIEMVHELGQILGPKHASIFVDSCIADLFNDCVARAETRTSRLGRSQEAWCHTWIGCLTLVREVLRGAFASVSEDNREFAKFAKKKIKYLGPLAASILPVIVSAPLCDLPLSPPDDSAHENDLCITNSMYPRPLVLPSDDFTLAALRGNAYILVGLIQFTCSLITLLREEATSLIPIVLPPLLGHATTTKVAFVREEAHAALEQISVVLCYKDFACMVDKNMGIVAGAIFAALRLPGGKLSVTAGTSPGDIFLVAHSIRSVLQLVLNKSNDEDEEVLKSTDISSYSYLLELVMTLTERYDYLASKGAYESETTIAIVGVYESAFRYLIRSYQSQVSAARKLRAEQSCATIPTWLERLGALRLAKTTIDEKESDCYDLRAETPREGFEAYRNRKEKEEQRNRGEESAPSLEHQLVDQRQVGSYETNFVAMLISRSTFFFSNASLRLQVESCAAMIEGFRFLAIAALLCKVSSFSSLPGL